MDYGPRSNKTSLQMSRAYIDYFLEYLNKREQ